MARATWKGSIGFGLVNVPVAMFTSNTERKVRFNQINSNTGNKVRQPKVDTGTGEEITQAEVVKGYEVAPNHYVIITPEELADLAPKKTSQITLEKFVDAGELDPIMYRATHYLAPQEGGEQAYSLLVAAMDRTNKCGIGTVVKDGVEKLISVRAKDGVMLCATLIWADEINPRPAWAKVENAPPAQVEMAAQLIESLTGTFDHSEYRDQHRTKVLALIEAKEAGTELPTVEVEAEADAPSLMAALEASLKATGKPKAKRPAVKPRKSKVAA